MQVNRYSNIQPARYTPRTLQEMMITPGYKRQQHDALDEQLSATETALAQVDPLDVHSERARAEQQKLYDQLSKQAEQLGSEGFTPTSKSDFTRLNKQYQQAISPTGDLGKIQSAKKVYAQNYKDYMTDALKKWDRNTAERNWAKFAQGYTGEDEEGNISNIGQLGAPERVELSEKLKEAKSLLGDQVVNEIAAGNYSFARQPDGSLAVVNRSGRRIETSNAPNIQNAMNRLNLELSDPNSAWRKSIDYEGVDPTLLAGQMTEGFRSMLSNKVTDNRRQSINFTGVKNLNDISPNLPNIPSVTEPVREFNNKRDKLYNNLSKLGKTSVQGVISIGEDSESIFNRDIENEPGIVFTKDDLSGAEKDQYDTIYKAMVKKGMINPSLDKFDDTNIKLIQKYLKDTETFSYSNKILKPGAIDNDLQQPLMITPKKGFDTEKHIKQEISSGRAKLFDKETQQWIDKDNLKGGKFEYVGMVSPDNALTKIGSGEFNEDSLVLPHVVQYTDSDGKTTEYYMTRDEEEMKKPEFKASRIIKGITLRTKQGVGMETSFSNADLHSKGIRDISTIYNPNTDSYTATFTDINGNKVTGENLTSSQLQNNIYRLFKKGN